MEAPNLFIKPNQEFSENIEAYLAATGALPREYETNSYLFAQGDVVQQTYYIKQGLVRLYTTSKEGYAKTLFYHKARTLIGYHFLRESTLSMFNAIACTPCLIYPIRHNDILALLKKDRQIAYHMCVYLFDQLELQAREAVNASMYSVLQRVCTLLYELVEEQNAAAPPVILPVSNQELSEMLGVHRNSINNAVSALKRSGCVEKRNGNLIIVDLEKLREIAKGLRAQ
jgi:CRP-like cAMP-binding protein